MFATDQTSDNHPLAFITVSVNKDSTSTMNLEYAWRYIQEINLDQMMNKFIDYYCWLRSDVENIARHYKQFLYLKKKYGHQYKLPPSVELDEFWHAHILDTQKYRIDCECIFGYYLDHYPYFGVDGNSDFDDLRREFEILQQLLQKEFGEQLRCYRGNIKRFYSSLKKITKKLHPIWVS